MPEIAWNLLQPVDTGSQVQQGFATGMALVKGVQSRNALKDYLANPDDPNAYSALAYLDPQMAAQAQQQHLLRRKDVQEQQDRQRAVSLGELARTDPAAARDEALGAGDFDLADTFGKLGDAEQKKAADFWSAAGPVAFKLKQTPDPEARKALWAQARPILESQGAPPHLLDSFDPTNDTQIEAALTTAQKVSDLIDQNKVVWHQQGEQPSFATDAMGRPVGTQNPYAHNGGSPPPAAAGGSGGTARGIRNNNPLNLTESEFTRSQPGFAGTDSGGRYAKFASPDAGLAAAHHLLGSYLQRGFDTPSEIISRWAPASENGGAATTNYVNFVSHQLGIAPDHPVSPDQIPALAQAMAAWENGTGSHAAKTATGGVPPHVTTKAELDGLPSGTIFIAPDGTRRRKP